MLLFLAIENVFCVCVAWYKHDRGWENSRRLCKPETKSRVCITVENSPNPSCVYIRLYRQKVFYCFYKITSPRKKRKTLCMTLIKREILTKSCTRKRFQIRACVISAQTKHVDVTTMFTYSHANTPLGQSDRGYCPSYFTNISTLGPFRSEGNCNWPGLSLT